MNYKQPSITVVIVILFLSLSACTITSPSNPMMITPDETTSNSPTEQSQGFHTPSTSSTNTQTPQAPIHLGLTFQQPNGNHFVSGQGSLPSQTPIEITSASKPVWIVGAPYQDGAIFIAVLEDSNLVAYYASSQDLVKTGIPPSPLAPGMPPQVGSSRDDYSLITVPATHQSSLTHPVFLPQSDWRAYIAQGGDLEFIDSSNQLIASL